MTPITLIVRGAVSRDINQKRLFSFILHMKISLIIETNLKVRDDVQLNAQKTNKQYQITSVEHNRNELTCKIANLSEP